MCVRRGQGDAAESNPRKAMKFILAFNALLETGCKHGFVELLRPLSFEEQVEEQWRIRDIEEAGEKWNPRKHKKSAMVVLELDAKSVTFAARATWARACLRADCRPCDASPRQTHQDRQSARGRTASEGDER